MKTYLEKWADDLLSRQSDAVTKPGCVEGVRDKALGPRSDYALVIIRFEACNSFHVECDCENRSELEACGYFDSIVFGLLDVLMTASAYPVRNISLRIDRAEIDPIHSSQMAFRLAGRDAGRKIVDLLSSKGPCGGKR